MPYVDGFLLPIPRRNIERYKKMARLAAKVWREHGALEYCECLGDDVKRGKLTSFPQSVKAKRGETVVFAWIRYRSRAHRDRVMAKVMKDPRVTGMASEKMPFDAKRMFFGGVELIVDV